MNIQDFLQIFLLLCVGMGFWTGTSGKNWLYLMYNTPGTRVELPANFAKELTDQLPTDIGTSIQNGSYFTTVVNDTEGVVIQNHSYQPYVIYVQLHLKLAPGTDWANDPWIQGIYHEYSLYIVTPGNSVLDQLRFPEVGGGGDVMMEVPGLPLQRTDHSYYFYITTITVEF